MDALRRRLALFALPTLTGIGVLFAILVANETTPMQQGLQATVNNGSSTFSMGEIHDGVEFGTGIRYQFECDVSSKTLFAGNPPSSLGMFIIYDLGDKTMYVGGRNWNRQNTLENFEKGHRYFLWSQSVNFSMQSCVNGLASDGTTVPCAAVTCDAPAGCHYGRLRYNAQQCLVGCGQLECENAPTVRPQQVQFDVVKRARDATDTTMIVVDTDLDGIKEIVTTHGVMSHDLKSIIPIRSTIGGLHLMVPSDLDHDLRPDFVGAFSTMTSGDTVGDALGWIYKNGDHYDVAPILIQGISRLITKIDGLRSITLNGGNLTFQAFNNMTTAQFNTIRRLNGRVSNVMFTDGGSAGVGGGMFKGDTWGPISTEQEQVQADMDGDGIKDQFIATVDTALPFKWISGCDGSEHALQVPAPSLRAMIQGQPTRKVWYALQDLDADGAADIVTWDNDENLVWYRAGDWSKYLIKANETPGPLVTGDMDGDKRPDIVIGAGYRSDARYSYPPDQPIRVITNNSSISGDLFEARIQSVKQCGGK